MQTEWIIYSIYGRNTHNKILEDTVLKNYPLYCNQNQILKKIKQAKNKEHQDCVYKSE